jgi:hypothetical protein
MRASLMLPRAPFLVDGSRGSTNVRTSADDLIGPIFTAASLARRSR